MDDAVRSMLDGGTGKPSWGGKNTAVGETIKGVILDITQAVQRDLDGNVKFFDAKEGEEPKPRMQLVILLQTTLNDPDIEDDDGQRRIFAKGGPQAAPGKKGAAMLNALREAQKDAKAKIDIGGTLQVTYVGEDKPSNPKYNGQKLWMASYTPPSVDLDELNG